MEVPAGRGRRGSRVKAKVVENKKEEISDYMKQAAALVHKYVPPDPETIGVTRRQFFNRSIVLVMGLSLTTFDGDV